MSNIYEEVKKTLQMDSDLFSEHLRQHIELLKIQELENKLKYEQEFRKADQQREEELANAFCAVLKLVPEQNYVECIRNLGEFVKTMNQHGHNFLKGIDETSAKGILRNLDKYLPQHTVNRDFNEMLKK